MISRIQSRWHPLWRLRQLAWFRRFQDRRDFTIYTRIPDTGIKVAVRLLRNLMWFRGMAITEIEIRKAFALVLETLKPAVFWDIGANIGFYSWLVRRHPSVHQVLMFEPDPVNFELITKTIRKNAITDCRAMNVALAESAGDAEFLLDRASGAAGSLKATSRQSDRFSLHHAYQLNEIIGCRTATIDGLIADGAPPPDLVKIDVEGAEHLVVAGGQSCFLGRPPTMIMETSNCDLVRGLARIGYAVFRVDAGNFLFVPTHCDPAPFLKAFSPYGESD
jgi:FkbM family methyltransferase